MPSILDTLDHAFRAAIRDAFGLDADPLIAPSANLQFGDYQSNAAMGLAKRVAEQTGAKTNPRQIAEQIKAKLDLAGVASDVSIAGPGFLNVRLDPAWLAGQMNVALADPRVGVPTTTSLRIVIDYPSPNIAKEMHVGHLRPAVIGDAIARTLMFVGHDVVKLNHIGDWGTAFGMLLAFMRENATKNDAPIRDIEQLYREAKQRFDTDPLFANESRQAVVRLQAGSTEELARWRQIVGISREHMEEMFALLGLQITRADERGESFYNDRLATTVADLKAKAIAVDSDGAVVAWVAGFDAPLMIQKSDGGYGYATTDLASLQYRVRDLAAERLVYVTDSRQQQHFRQFRDVGERAGWLAGVPFEHAMFGTILGLDGKPIKTKSGESVKLRDVLNEAIDRAAAIVAGKSPDLPAEQRSRIARAVGIGSIKYFDLARDRVGDYTFDWEKMLSLDGNTGVYLQYAHARIRSIFRKSTPAAATSVARITALTEPQEVTLAKTLLRFDASVESVARELKPHVLCTYLYELAGAFSSFYEACPVLKSDEPTRSSRLALCDLTARTIACGLDLLGIEHPEQM